MFFFYIIGWDEIGSQIPMSGTFELLHASKASSGGGSSSSSSSIARKSFYIDTHTQTMSSFSPIDKKELLL